MDLRNKYEGNAKSVINEYIKKRKKKRKEKLDCDGLYGSWSRSAMVDAYRSDFEVES